jgi:hypothetical protein
MMVLVILMIGEEYFLARINRYGYNLAPSSIEKKLKGLHNYLNNQYSCRYKIHGMTALL